MCTCLVDFGTVMWEADEIEESGIFVIQCTQSESRWVAERDYYRVTWGKDVRKVVWRWGVLVVVLSPVMVVQDGMNIQHQK